METAVQGSSWKEVLAAAGWGFRDWSAKEESCKPSSKAERGWESLKADGIGMYGARETAEDKKHSGWELGGRAQSRYLRALSEESERTSVETWFSAMRGEKMRSLTLWRPEG